jgi:hypothetical protein
MNSRNLFWRFNVKPIDFTDGIGETDEKEKKDVV